MRIPQPRIPDKWLAAFESDTDLVEQRVAIIMAWVVLITMPMYQTSHHLRNVDSEGLWMAELLFRIPGVLCGLLTLAALHFGRPQLPARALLRMLGISVMVMILALFLIHYRDHPDNMTQLSNGLVITFFGVTALAIRGLREWCLVFLTPFVIFLVIAPFAGIPRAMLLPLLFDPMVMVVITLVATAAVRHLRIREFLARQELTEIASTDQLTGLLNRRPMHPLMVHEVNRARRTGTPFSIVLGDLDRFKKVNDTYGHEAGDLVLQETARRLQAAIRAQDIVCRWGGEELLILLPETGPEGAGQVAEKIRAAMDDAPVQTGNEVIHQTISLGVSSFRPDDTVTTLISRADEALYEAKSAGRNRVVQADQPG
ncbi:MULTISPECIES: GGDEF domain-containing protein [Marinobacter]|uniref:GGDEF domain-containing protein n=1 Tax=Marinobacter TaxID=2742 RepID=UPI001475508E|nr:MULTISPECIES: GGDEF domain-containing protein [Marinobacter]MBD3658089.1 GGDEF domain-containing protein [Marinobacter sp.]